MSLPKRILACATLAASGMQGAYAGGVPTAVLDEVVVTARRLGKLQGAPLSASQGDSSARRSGAASPGW